MKSFELTAVVFKKNVIARTKDVAICLKGKDDDGVFSPSNNNK